MFKLFKGIQDRVADKAAKLVADKMIASHPAIESAKINAEAALESAHITAKAQRDAAKMRTSSSLLVGLGAACVAYVYVRPLENKIKEKDVELKETQTELKTVRTMLDVQLDKLYVINEEAHKLATKLQYAENQLEEMKSIVNPEQLPQYYKLIKDKVTFNKVVDNKAILEDHIHRYKKK